MTKEIWMERMTWQEIEQAMADGFDTVLLIAGSIEQHGPALPLGTDTFLGYALADGVARKMGKTLVAPVVRPGLSEHHMHFKGSLTLSRETFKAVVRETVDSLTRHGFKRIAMTYSHGGNRTALEELMPELARSYPKVDILTLKENNAFSKPVDDIISRDGITVEQMGVHAGEMETSMMLAWDEALVRQDKYEQGFMADFEKEGAKLAGALAQGLHTLTKNGILGDSRPASKARGEEYNDAVCGYIAAHFTKVNG
jgi:creatinine amidohydrolase/Fe(II)-dependent formamide hydrolase-like protein